MDERLNDVERTVEIHGEKIKNLEEFSDIHEKKHEGRDKEHDINTYKINVIERIFIFILATIGTVVLGAILNLVIKK
ncbi:MAG: hypothetical protein JXM74_04600 [Fusobacteriaceae bacterium]|nr:hypothetical protein [Fusobacteriaceae bacterium]MBN2838015.1 hypothetical protein [Fusobacteriaceae bacterium]